MNTMTATVHVAPMKASAGEGTSCVSGIDSWPSSSGCDSNILVSPFNAANVITGGRFTGAIRIMRNVGY